MNSELTGYRCKLCKCRVFISTSYENHGHGFIEPITEIICQSGCETKQDFDIEEDGYIYYE